MERSSAMAFSSSLRIHNLDMNRDQWDNVPTLVTKSFQILQNNLSAIKKWSDKQEERQKQVGEFHQQLEVRLDAMDEALSGTQDKLKELQENLEAINGHLKDHSSTLAGAVRRTIYYMRLTWERFGRAWGVNLEIVDSEKDLLLREQDDTGDLEHLGLLCDGLESQVQNLTQCFDLWAVWRQRAEQERREMGGSIKELSSGAQRTRQRLIQWREMLRENARAVDVLSAALGAAQADVKQLQHTQVQQVDIDRSVSGATEQMEQLAGRTDARVTGVKDFVETHFAEAEKAIVTLRQRTEERIEEHSSRVAQLLERSFNPVNAYLNAMHVKSDVLRSDTDRLLKDLPELATRVDKVLVEVDRVDGEARGERSGLLERIEKMGMSHEELRHDQEAKHTEVVDAISEFRGEVAQEVGELLISLQQTNDELRSLQRGELTNVKGDISTLEQKVAKWIHAHPLPAKISEARLYALEARLTEETDARVKFEENLKGSVSADGGAGLALPTLQMIPRPQCSYTVLRLSKVPPSIQGVLELHVESCIDPWSIGAHLPRASGGLAHPPGHRVSKATRVARVGEAQMRHIVGMCLQRLTC